MLELNIFRASKEIFIKFVGKSVSIRYWFYFYHFLCLHILRYDKVGKDAGVKSLSGQRTEGMWFFILFDQIVTHQLVTRIFENVSVNDRFVITLFSFVT